MTLQVLSTPAIRFSVWRRANVKKQLSMFCFSTHVFILRMSIEVYHGSQKAIILSRSCLQKRNLYYNSQSHLYLTSLITKQKTETSVARDKVKNTHLSSSYLIFIVIQPCHWRWTEKLPSQSLLGYIKEPFPFKKKKILPNERDFRKNLWTLYFYIRSEMLMPIIQKEVINHTNGCPKLYSRYIVCSFLIIPFRDSGS